MKVTVTKLVFFLSVAIYTLLGYEFSVKASEGYGPTIYGIQLGMSSSEVYDILKQKGYKIFNINNNGDTLISEKDKNNPGLGWLIKKDRNPIFGVSFTFGDNVKISKLNRIFIYVREAYQTNLDETIIKKFCENYNVPMANPEMIASDDREGIEFNNRDEGYCVSFVAIENRGEQIIIQAIKKTSDLKFE